MAGERGSQRAATNRGTLTMGSRRARQKVGSKPAFPFCLEELAYLKNGAISGRMGLSLRSTVRKFQPMRAYLAIKFKEDYSNRPLIEDICRALEKARISMTVMVRDFEKWGENHFAPSEMMRKAFDATEKSDALIIELTEKGVGLGIEAGYASAKRIPIYVIAKTGSDISDTLRGLAREVVFYDAPAELTEKFRSLLK